jgi:hypothetical protein
MNNNLINSTIGIVDEPNKSEDTLDIGRHAAALTKFIKHTATPMTVGIQGEWGSGKTSLLNQIHDALDEEGKTTLTSDGKQKNKYKQIWINAWEHSLLAQPEEALLKIINEIIQEMLSSDANITNREQITKIASNVFKGALRVGASIVGGTEAGKVTSELLGEKKSSIKELRNQLDNLAKEIEGMGSNDYERIVIYVDDLDRIEPKNAVQILELLKNIFSIPKCVFILAIDYQVVVKGLKEKFGEQTEENEWEFRAFFDKIIQLPFMMPMGQYNIGKYVGGLLEQINFIEDSSECQEHINRLVQFSIGGNPRSLKRLVNSLTLIDIFSGIELETPIDGVNNEVDVDENTKLLLLAIVCLQISYPTFYDLLVKNPDFLKWNKNIAFKVTKLAEERKKDKFDKDLSIAKESENFNEEWEEAIYRICYSKPRYYSRVDNISRFFNFIKDELLKDKQDDVENTIAEVLEKTAVTNVSSTDDTQAQLPTRKGSGKRLKYDDLDMTLLSLKSEGRAEEQLEAYKTIYDNCVDALPNDIEIRYWAWYVTFFVNKHKFLRLNINRRKPYFGLALVKTFENNYKIPDFNSKNIHAEHIQSWSQGFNIRFADLDVFNHNKEKLFDAIYLSYDVAKNHWKTQLVIKTKKGMAKGRGMDGEEFDFDNNPEKADELAQQYLSDDWCE